MGNKYTEEEWVDFRRVFTIPPLVATILNYRKMYAIPNEHQDILIKTIKNEILKEGQQESVLCKTIKEINEVIFGNFIYIPIYINSYPSMVKWRLEHGK